MAEKRTLITLFERVKERISRNELTLKELSENADIPEELLTIFFDDENNIIRDLSNLINFMKFKVTGSELKFQTYHILETQTQFKITRTIKPKCAVIYEKATKRFYNFRAIPIKKDLISETKKQIILSEAKDMIDKVYNFRNNDKNNQ